MCQLGPTPDPGRNDVQLDERTALRNLPWLDQSTADPVEKARRVLDALGDESDAYFFDDGFPRTLLREQVANVLAVLNALACSAEATGKPAGWIQPDHLSKASVAPFLCRVEPAHRDDFVPIYTESRHPAQSGFDGCTESNCERCRTHPDHRGDMRHAGIGSYPRASVPQAGALTTDQIDAIREQFHADDMPSRGMVQRIATLAAAQGGNQ